MPLSEEELRLLEQMEQALAQEDPKFVSTLRGSSLERVARMRTIAAAVVFVLGVAHAHGRRDQRRRSGSASSASWSCSASATIGLAAWRGRHAPAAQPQRSGEDQLFDFDDHPHRFDVIDGGRTERPRKLRRHRRQQARAASPGDKAPKQGTFMQRMEQRWERRRNQGY